jgi:hypothetical protein
MVRITGARRLAALAAGVVSIAAAATAVEAATTPGFAVVASPESRTLAIGGSTTFAMTVTRQHGFTGTVALSAQGAPRGVTVATAPGSLALGAAVTSASATVTVVAGTTASPGTYTLTLTGKSGSVTGAAQVRLTIPPPPPSRALTLTAVPASAVLVPGNTAGYTIGIARTGVAGAVALAVTGLPGGAVAAFSAEPATGASSVLSVRTTGATPEGRFPLTVTGRSGTVLATTTVTLVVERPGVPFQITGPHAPHTALAPGVTAPLNLAVTNPNAGELRVTNLTVDLVSTSAAGCPVTTNYRLTPFGGTYPLTVPAGSTRTLQQLGVPSALWPRLTMLDLPANQDACRGATITLKHSGAGNGGVTS